MTALRPLHLVFFARYAAPVIWPGQGGVVGGAEVKMVGFAREIAKDPSVRVTIVTEVMGGQGQGHGRGEGGGEGEGAGWRQGGGTGEGQGRGVPAVRTFPVDRGGGRVTRILKDRKIIQRALIEDAPDVILQSCTGPETLDMVMAARRSGAKAVYWAANSGDFEGGFWNDLGIVRGAAFRVAMPFVDAFLCQTPEQMESLRKWLGRDGFLVRNAVDRPEAPASGGGERRGAIWAGKWNHWKRPEYFLDLVRKCPEHLHVMLISTGGNAALQQKILAATAGIPNLEIHFDVPVDQVAGHLEKARLHVNSSYQEGFPNAMLQAAALGLPTLAHTVDPGALLSSGELGATAGGDDGRYTERLDRYLRDDDHWLEASTRARAYVAENHDIRKEAAKLLAYLRSLVGKQET